MLKSILDKVLPQLKTLEEAHGIIKELCRLVGELGDRVEQLDEQLEVNSSNSSRPHHKTVSSSAPNGKRSNRSQA